MVKRTIIIKGVPFSYDEIELSYANTNPMSPEDGRCILIKTRDLLKLKGLNVYLTFGTLLGAVRDKAIIKGDEDVDVFVDNEEMLVESIPYLYENGLKVFRCSKGSVYSFCMGTNTYIDIYILRPLKWSIWSFYCYALHKNVTPKKFFKEYQNIEFLGDTFMCPKNPESLLEFWYGKSWRTPIKGHKFLYEVKSAYFFHNQLKPFVQKMIGWYYWRHIVKKEYRKYD